MQGSFSQLDIGIWIVEETATGTIVAASFVEKLSVTSLGFDIAFIEHWIITSTLDRTKIYKIRAPTALGDGSLEDNLSSVASVKDLITVGQNQNPTWKYIPAFCPLAKQL